MDLAIDSYLYSLEVTVFASIHYLLFLIFVHPMHFLIVSTDI